jgi:signal transduction histidine kinase
MSVKKLLLIVLLMVALISVGINALILGSLTDRFFVGYLKDTYENHVEQIKNYSLQVLLYGTSTPEQLKADLETHLIDPIYRIRLFDKNGRMLADVSSDYYLKGMMMDGRMARMRPTSDEATDQYLLEENGETFGSLYVTRHSSTDNSLIARLFKMALVSNSIRAVAIAFAISAAIGLFISRVMSRDLKDTAVLATDIQEGRQVKAERSFVSEITSIRGTLEDLSIKLRLKQKSRKELTDQLIHETRTPLTILKTHLEGIGDGVIEADDSEIEVLKGQIDSITAIISNLSSMIDAEESTDEARPEEFELSKVLRQIINGLSAQFDKKGIQLIIETDEKILMNTDKFKLSQIVYNLLINAYKYTESGGRTVLRYKKSDNNVEIQVEDNGSGIDEIDQGRIFNAYFRGSGSTGSGEGIGLFVVKENARLLEGEVKVESQKGKGSIFTLVVPLDL